MSERISRSEPDGSLSQGPDRSSRLHGAALGCVGTLLTLMLGGGVLMLVTAALTIGPGGSEVERHLLAHIWQFSFGIWLIVPATLAGTIIGYDKTRVLQPFLGYGVPSQYDALNRTVGHAGRDLQAHTDCR